MNINDKYQTVKEWATAYRKIGWNVIPLYNNDKSPALVKVKKNDQWVFSWKDLESRFSTDEEFAVWFDDPRITGVGLICGKISGVVVIDEDSYKAGGMKFNLISPVRTQTVNGGTHHFFKYSEAVKTTGLKDKVFIEIKSDGGFVVLPPSIVTNKQGTHGKYQWVEASVGMNKLPTITEAELAPYKPLTRSASINLVEKAHAPFGTQHNNLRDIANAILNRFRPDEWEQLAYPAIRSAAAEFDPPHPLDRVEKMIQNCSVFILNNPKDVPGRSEKQTAQPLSLAEIGRRRTEDRKLEKGAPLTGYPELDKIVKGFLPKHFWTITGETNVGKTAFACNLAEHIRSQKRNVLYVALEPEYKVADYLASVRLKKTFENITEADTNFDDGNIVVFTLKEVPTYPDLIRSVREGSKKYDVIIIDHIGYFCRSTNEGTFLAQQSDTIRDFVALSKELQTCVIAIAHPRKPSSSTTNRVLSMYDISGTAGFAQDSTEVIVLYRPTINEEDKMCTELSNEGMLLVQKTKSGKNGSFRIHFHDDKALIETDLSCRLPQQEVASNDYDTTITNSLKPFLKGASYGK